MPVDTRTRWRRAILAEITWGDLSQKAIDWYLQTYFGALDRTWVLQGISRAVIYGPGADAENVFRRIITTQDEKAAANVPQ